MAEIHWVYTALGAIVVFCLFIGGVIFLREGIQDAKIEETEGMLFLNKRSSAHLIEKCLRNDGEYIVTDFLYSFSERDICMICGICTIELGVKVEDLEDSREWDFGYDETAEVKSKSELFTNIKSGDEVHVGKIYTEI